MADSFQELRGGLYGFIPLVLHVSMRVGDFAVKCRAVCEAALRLPQTLAATFGCHRLQRLIGGSSLVHLSRGGSLPSGGHLAMSRDVFD